MDKKHIIYLFKNPIFYAIVVCAALAIGVYGAKSISQNNRHSHFLSLAMEYYSPIQLQNITYDQDGTAFDSLNSLFSHIEKDEDIARTADALRHLYNEATSNEPTPFMPYAEEIGWGASVAALINEDTASAANILRILQDEFPISIRRRQTDSLLNKIKILE